MAFGPPRPAPEPSLWAVAGCLFEVHLPRSPSGGHWDWVSDDDAAVTLLAAHPTGEPPDSCRLRFRAERPGEIELCFTPGDGGPGARLAVRIVPEMLDG